MARSIQKYLYDIQQSISSIEEYLGEKRDFFAYEQNKLLRRAVERELEIIGEAAKHILDMEPDIQIDDARKIVDLRNFVIHGYDKVDNVIIWGVVNKNLPKLKEQVEDLGGDEMLCLYIFNPTQWVMPLFSTHPPIEERIRLLRNMY